MYLSPGGHDPLGPLQYDLRVGALYMRDHIHQLMPGEGLQRLAGIVAVLDEDRSVTIQLHVRF